MSLPLAYFITIRTYGTWLHGDTRGSVDDRHNAYASPKFQPDTHRQTVAKKRMANPPFLLAADSASLVEKTIVEVCAHRRWHLHCVKARTNHVHVVVGAPLAPERIMNDLKAWATRRLREHAFAGPQRRIWAEHGCTPHLWSGDQLAGAINYVQSYQGGPLQKPWNPTETAA